MSEIDEGIDYIKRFGFDADLTKNLVEIVQISVEAGRDAERERCAELAERFSDQGRDGHQIAKAIRKPQESADG